MGSLGPGLESDCTIHLWLPFTVSGVSYHVFLVSQYLITLPNGNTDREFLKKFNLCKIVYNSR